jgi:DnaJ-class molecular chaperone
MKRDEMVGNLIVEYTVTFPTTLDDSTKEVISNLLDS